MLVLQIALTVILALTVSSIDLFSVYRKNTLKQAWGWVLVYLLLNVFASVFVFIGSLNIDVNISMNKGTISLGDFSQWVKAVLCGMFLLTILKSRMFMIKVGQIGDVINPEYRFQQIINVIKVKIAEGGLEDNLKSMQRLLMNLSIDELTNGANLITNTDELWLYSEEKKKLAIDRLNKIDKIKNEQDKKKSLCKFIYDFGAGLDLTELFSAENLLANKKWRDLIMFLEKESDSLSQEDISYIEKFRDDHRKAETLELKNDSKEELIEFILDHYTDSEIFEFLNK
ncbi:MAG: hypothetical protein HQL02_06680 [Nitrospirae bacterium]|nr:hypothetical protein [Nitrospirota bacterium]